MKLKKLLVALLAFAMVLPLSGCSKEPTDVTLTVWAPAEDQDETAGNWLKTMCDKFNEAHPEWNITFQYGTCSEGDIGKTIPTDPKNSADVYLFANDQIGALKEANAIAKLGGKAAEEVKANNPQLLVDSVTVDGDIYGIPFTSNTWFMYYDKSVFTEEDVKSLDTMVAKAKISFPMTTAWYNGSFFFANGGTMFGDGTDAAAGIQFGGDAGTAALQYMVDLVANPNFVNDGDGAGMAGLRNGTVKALFSGSWDYSNVKGALGDNLGAAQLPTITINGEAKQLKSFAGSKAVGVNPNCANQEVAVALARYLASEEAQKAHYEMRDGSVIPSHVKLASDADLAKNPIVKAIADTCANTAIVQPTLAEMGPYWAAADTLGKAVVDGKVTKDNAAQKVQDYVNQLNAK